MRDEQVGRHRRHGPRRRTRVLPVLSLVAAVLLSACSGGAEQQIDDLSSNAAAARMIAADRLAGSVPSHYSSRLLADLSDEVKTTADALKPGSLPSSLSSSALAASHDLQAVIQTEQDAVESGDASRLRAAMDRAGALHERLQSLSQQAEAAEQ